MNTKALALLTLFAVSCGPPQVSSEETARRAFLGLDRSIGKSLTLGFAGFNAASSANIPDQSTTGDDGGTLTISGQVDQGASANKGMRLKVAMAAYSDGVVSFDGGTVRLVFATSSDQPALNLQLKNIPDGTYTGSLAGTYQMQDDLTGTVQLDLSMSGQLENDGSGKTRRKVGTTTVTGTATSASGVFQVNVTQ
ncbi:MAG: hypothetical protein Q8S33_01785 [Myxococcales bacterium]|nr:hypothetical protein [Myxococcales bacterium]MDP3499026.1 hypothetical protein [Myxococcales bacterium]